MYCYSTCGLIAFIFRSCFARYCRQRTNLCVDVEALTKKLGTDRRERTDDLVVQAPDPSPIVYRSLASVPRLMKAHYPTKLSRTSHRGPSSGLVAMFHQDSALRQLIGSHTATVMVSPMNIRVGLTLIILGSLAENVARRGIEQSWQDTEGWTKS